jgi:CHAT domain-containing protein/predicted negative regulator of RcsB-dependent stress response
MNRWVMVVSFAVWGACAQPVHGLEYTDQDFRESMTLGRIAFEKGAFQEAINQWTQATSLSGEESAEDQVEALVNLGAAYESIGQPKLAVSVLEKATHVAATCEDPSRVILAKSSLGVACMYAHLKDQAEQNLRESLTMARTSHDLQMTAVILNNLANLLAEQGKTQDALDAFEESASLAHQMTNTLLMAKSLCNAAATAARTAQWDSAMELNQRAIEAIRLLPPSHDQAFLLIEAGRTDWQASQNRPEARSRLIERAEDTYSLAGRLAEQIDDEHIKTFALGYLAQVHEFKSENDEALSLTRQAVFFAQQAHSPNALYRWEWQTGRLLRKKGDLDGAIGAYHRAVETFQPIRHDLSFGYCTACSGSRESVSPLFLELADLLMQRADTIGDRRGREKLLMEARDTVEQLKTAELEDYFQDECVNLLRAKAVSIEAVSSSTAVIYIIPLPDRTELLVGLSTGLTELKVPISGDQLTDTVRNFRLHLEKKSTNQYMVEAQQLYSWLVSPIKNVLTKNRVDTLVFVPDGSLATIPMSALYDGEHFLVEQFAIAVTPGLTLMEPKPIRRKNIEVLTGGLSESTGGFPALPNVATELNEVHALFGGVELVNEKFVIPTLKRDMAQDQYQIVHFATHGQFGADSGNTFILTHDGELTPNQLEELIRPSQFRGKPVELLTLSACETAAGDDRAALGLAGVALKAGARSALATLWLINDKSTTMLISGFYNNFRHDPNVSKAKALQQAQIKLLSDSRYEHPAYWAPFMIIGNWL